MARALLDGARLAPAPMSPGISDRLRSLVRRRAAPSAPLHDSTALQPQISAERAALAADAEDIRLLRERVARFAIAASVVLFLFWLVALVFYLRGDPVDRGIAYDLVWIVALPIVAAIARRSKTSPSTLRALDAFSMVLLGAFWALNAYQAPLAMPMEIPLVFMTTILAFTRVVLVPSSFQRTAWIGLLTVAPTIVVIVARGGAFLKGNPPGNDVMFVAFGSVWMLVLVGMTAYASQLIFGLQRQVRIAMRLGQYVLEREIGRGSTGTVFLGRHVLLKRPAAIKVLHRERTAMHAASFEREVKITSSLSHPNTVTVLDFGWSGDGVFYYVMEYLPGLNLEQLVRAHGAQPDWRVVHILRQAAGSLAEAHARGLLHRDVKPANLIVSERGGVPDVVHVVDFGLASKPAGASSASLTGTPGYMAPETITRDAPPDERSDVYSLGAVAYWLCTGTHVFDAVTAADLCMKHVAADVDPPSLRAGRPLHPELERIVLDCLAKHPEKRPASAHALLDRLDALAEELPFDASAARAFWAGWLAEMTGSVPGLPAAMTG